MMLAAGGRADAYNWVRAMMKCTYQTDEDVLTTLLNQFSDTNFTLG